MYALTEAQYLVEAEPILRQVFINNNPFEHPFSPNIIARRIIYSHQCYVEPPLLDAVIAAAANLGDAGCYFSQLWTTPNKTNHCYIPLSELLEAYPGSGNEWIEAKLNMDVLPENVLYSNRGKWGIMLSHEFHGLLGGPPEFIEDICRIIPDLNEQIYAFLNRFQSFKLMKPDGLTLGWLPGLLEHVYGKEAAERMLRETELL